LNHREIAASFVNKGSKTAQGDRNVAFFVVYHLFYYIHKNIYNEKMTCKQLGGACDIEFIGETFNEIVNNL